MGNTFELRNQDIQQDSLKQAQDIGELQKALDEQKELILQQTTIEDANKLLEDTPVVADNTDLQLQVGDTYLQAKDNAEYKQFFQTIKNDIKQ